MSPNKKVRWKDFINFQVRYSDLFLFKRFGQAFCEHFQISEDSDPTLYNTGSQKIAWKIIFEY